MNSRSSLATLCAALFLLGIFGIKYPSTGYAEENEEKPTKLDSFPAFAQFRCKSSSEAFTAKIAGANDALFSLKFGNCTVNLLSGGRFGRGDGISIRQSLELKLNPNADISQCNAMTFGILIEVGDVNAPLSWSGFLRATNNVGLENFSGDNNDIAHFKFHDNVGKTGLTVGKNFLGDDEKAPTFSEYFWGELNIDGVESENSLADILNAALPVVGKEEIKPSLEMQFELAVKDVQGWCTQSIEPAKGGKAQSSRRLLQFSD